MTVVELAGAVRGGTALRGRATELAAVQAGLAAARRGRGSVVLVEGRPGMGRTSFLRETLHRAEQAGVRALAGEAVNGQQTLPFAPLLTAVLDGESPIADPVALRAAATRADLRYWVSHDLRAALEAAAVRGPLAIVLDDLQWADPGTLAALRMLTSSLRDSGIVWVLAFTGAGAEPPLRAFAGAGAEPSVRAFAGAGAEPSVRAFAGGGAEPSVRELMSHLARRGALRVRLAPLTPADAAAVVRDLVGGPVGPDLLALAGQAGGSPFVLTELIRGLREEERLLIGDRPAGVLGSEPPRRLTEVLNQRLGRLGPDARQAILMAAMLPCRFTASQLAGLLRCRPSALVEPLDELLRADLVAAEHEHLRISCELLRGAVRASVPESLRMALRHETAAGTGPCAPGWADLTPSELKVAQLIAAGATNRTAAQKLCLSPHTVGTHLRHIFEKLGINSRVELANLMHDRAA